MVLASAAIVLAAFAGEEGAAPAPAGAARAHHEGPMATVLEEAKASGRPVLIDFFTEWCGWCGVMDRKVFADPAVSALCNEGYVVFKVDAEKGEGVALNAKYGVRVYPTFVFTDGAGEELDRQVGYCPKDRFLPLLEDVKAGNHRKGLEALLEKNPGDAVARAKYGIKLFEAGDATGAREHLEKAAALDPEDAHPETVAARYKLCLFRTMEERSPESLKDYVKKYPDAPAAVDAHRVLLASSRRTGTAEERMVHIEILLQRAPDAEIRNEAAWVLATHGKELERALSLVSAALEEDPKNAAYLDTKAECLSRLGRHDEAVAAQEEAVANLPAGTPADQRAGLEERLEEFRRKRDEAKAPPSPAGPPSGK